MIVPNSTCAPPNSKQEDWQTNPPSKQSSEAALGAGVFKFEDGAEESIPTVLPVIKGPPAGEEPPPRPSPPINHPGEFVRIQRMWKGRTFPYQCYGCDTVVQLRQRVTQTKRVCPGCGKAITIAGIDSQIESMVARGQHGGCATMLLSVLATFFVVFLLALEFG
jgi:predicted RNA-binding Zn-ribbon protein involved in translation (DUF1610 family)